MDIWLIQDGEKVGPYNDYEIRSRIESGELTADIPAWHEHLDHWTPLDEIDSFHQSFAALEANKRQPSATDPSPTELVDSTEDETLRERHAGRRFWARMLDLHFYGGAWWLLMWLSGRDLELLYTEAWTRMLLFVPWFIIETLLIHRFATTPGKWLLNIKVLNLDGSKLSLRASILRSVRILFMGIGFGIDLLMLLCMTLSWIGVQKLGRPLWDRVGGHFVDTQPLNRYKVMLYIGSFLFALWLQMIVLYPYTSPHSIEAMEEWSPQVAESMKQNPPWHLPKR